ncbi:MAG: DUF1376 domain-containing protein [Xanthobacteraceae bacterium]|nr:DUF1376 domain-containing protein [Xanthobacteraceae bacterium]
MTSKPWMPLYIADYLADTAHLRALQSGAYLHLVMHYWMRGSLPDDDGQLAAIAKLSAEEWADNRAVLRAFFGHGWRHKRIDAELRHSEEISAGNRSKARKAANIRWGRVRTDAPGNAASTAQAMLQNAQSQSQSHLDDDERAKPKSSIGSPLISDAAFKLANEIARLCGHGEGFLPPNWAGAPMQVQSWLNQGWAAEAIEASCREQVAKKRGPPPDRIVYFETGIADFVARVSASVPTAPEVKNAFKLSPSQQRLAERRAFFEQRRRDRERNC